MTMILRITVTRQNKNTIEMKMALKITMTRQKYKDNRNGNDIANHNDKIKKMTVGA